MQDQKEIDKMFEEKRRRLQDEKQAEPEQSTSFQKTTSSIQKEQNQANAYLKQQAKTENAYQQYPGVKLIRRDAYTPIFSPYYTTSNMMSHDKNKTGEASETTNSTIQ